MEARFKKWHQDIDNITNQFLNKFADIGYNELNWKPEPKRWSIGQVIEHLLITNRSYFVIPDKIKSNNYKPSFLNNFGFIPKLIGNIILKSVDPNNEKKVKTMKVFEPEKSNIDLTVFSDFDESQQKLHEFINDNKDMIRERKIIPSPLNKHIIYHFDIVIDIVVNHQKRHYNQANKVFEILNSDGNL